MASSPKLKMVHADFDEGFRRAVRVKRDGIETGAETVLNSKALLVLAALVIGLLFWQSRSRTPLSTSSVSVDVGLIAAGTTQESSNAAAFNLNGFRLQPLAEFSVQARVLSAREYSSDTEAKLSPVDLALGWGQMADPAVYEKLNISQGGRWYRYSWPDQPPIPVNDIIRSSANMHMIPANDDIAATLLRARRGDIVTLKGKLVEVSGDNQWTWRSSLSRTDSGQGACELVYVEAIAIKQ